MKDGQTEERRENCPQQEPLQYPQQRRIVALSDTAMLHLYPDQATADAESQRRVQRLLESNRI